MKKGKFVVIEGLDGSGKKTQLDLLVEYCRQKKIKAAVVDFPQYYKTFFGKLAGRYLRGEFGETEAVSPYLASLLYAGDRWQAKAEMNQVLEEGKLLLANRYTSSSMAFMGGKIKTKKARDKFFNWLKKLEWKVYGCPKPDLVIYLSVSPVIGQKLVDKKDKRKYLGNKENRDIHEKNLAYLGKVAAVYLDLYQRLGYWEAINCVDKGGKIKSRRAIQEMVIEVLKRRKIIAP